MNINDKVLSYTIISDSNSNKRAAGDNQNNIDYEQNTDYLQPQKHNDDYIVANENNELMNAQLNKRSLIKSSCGGDSTDLKHLSLDTNQLKQVKQNLDVISLDPITINPGKQKQPYILNLQQTFTFPSDFGQKKQQQKETFTQTSKTLIELIKTDNTNVNQNTTSSDEVEEENSNISDNLFNIKSPRQNFPEYSETTIADQTDETNENTNDNHKPFRLIANGELEYNEKNKIELLKLKRMLQTKSAINKPSQNRSLRKSSAKTPIYTRKIYTPRPLSKHKLFCGTRKAELVVSPRRESFMESYNNNNDNNNSNNNINNNGCHNTETVVNSENGCSSTDSVYNNDMTLTTIIDKLQDSSWEISLQGLRELFFIAPRINWLRNERDISIINRKLIDLFRSPRSNVCRITCQVSGELFRILKCTKRPEFDEIVDILLNKTADSNRFIQKDANIALDKMVTYISSFHSVRVLCNKGPCHKNPLVRTATVRLLVCVCAISGVETIIGTSANSHTRKRILTNLAKFLTDKNIETRKFGERMCRMLKKHKFFEEYFYKDLEAPQKFTLKKIVNSLDPNTNNKREQ